MRKGMKPRSKDQRKGAANEVPGDKDNPRTFIEIKRNEQNLAAYLGFTDTSDLRRFALSWPVIKAFMPFHEISAHLPKLGL